MSKQDNPNKKIANKFIEELKHIKNDRGKMAVLRRAATGQTRNQVAAWPIIFSLGGNIQSAEKEYVGIAALYAMHPEIGNEENFGEICKKISLKKTKGVTITESAERRFRRLILSDNAEELCEQLRSWIRMAKSEGISVNYEKLFQDILEWKYNADFIRKDWAASFWGVKKESVES